MGDDSANKVPGDKTKGIWNGGVTKPNGDISREEAKIFRQMEDSYDLDDSEIHFRSELVERERLMKEEQKNQTIQSKYSLSNDVNTKPLHELYQDIDYSEKTPISGMGGVGGPIDVIRSKSVTTKDTSSITTLSKPESSFSGGKSK